MAPSDSDLMTRVQAGETHLFEELVSRHYRGLLNYFYRLSWDRHMAEDAVQEVFLRVYRSRGSYRPSAKFTTFLYRIAHNYWIDLFRARKTRGPMASLDTPSQEGTGASLGDRIPARGKSPRESAADAESRDRLREALASLTPGLRAVFLLSNEQGLKYEEIGQILRIPVGTVKSRMHEAVRRLRHRLEDENVE
jgi:RNA polymerase sigma-70 factor (ECF subfamily)